MSDLTTIRNIGPAFAAECRRVGILTAESLREIGADAAYARMLKAGTRPHFIGYYVLHMALQGRPWNDCKGAEKDALRVQFDKLVSENKSLNDTGIEKVLNEIGTGLRR